MRGADAPLIVSLVLYNNSENKDGSSRFRFTQYKYLAAFMMIFEVILFSTASQPCHTASTPRARSASRNWPTQPSVLRDITVWHRHGVLPVVHGPRGAIYCHEALRCVLPRWLRRHVRVDHWLRARRLVHGAVQ
jgi:hypothetical protein